MVPNPDCRADVLIVPSLGTVCEALSDSQCGDKCCHPTEELHFSKHLDVSCEWLTVIVRVLRYMAVLTK